MTDERGAWFAAAAEFTPLVVVETAHGRFLVRTCDEMGGSLFVKRRRSEFGMIDRLAKMLDFAGKTLIDVGANIGTTTIPALRHFARVIAVEAAPENVEMLRLNLVLNGVEDRVRVVAAAASDTPGEVSFVLHPNSSGKHHLGRAKSADAQVVTVPATTLDAIDLDVASIGLVWVDVQGHEAAVFRGANRLIDAGVPILFEWQPTWAAKSAVVDEIRSYPSFVDMRDPTLTSRPMNEIDEFAASAGRTDVLLHHATGVNRR